MGFPTEFNWVLKLKPEQGYRDDPGTYKFTKKDYRVYPIDKPIFLVDADWNVTGLAVVESSRHKEGETRGYYRILRMLDEDERQMLTKIFDETRNSL